jgi:ubiquinone/menaquinone biosynthesis C-methylase UbiE
VIDGWAILALLLFVIALGAVLWWLLIISEGVYLGRRVVIWLYDVYADRYDRIKGYQPHLEHQHLAQPIMDEIAPLTAPLMLDVATGTGRLPLAMLRHPAFTGRIIATDLSARMLRRAAGKLDGSRNVTCALAAAEHQPFADGTFDVVTCLEALEFVPRRETVIAELLRLVRPGGLLLLTNRIGERLMPGRLYSEAALVEVLADYDAESIYIEHWQVDYDLVWVRKTA